MVDQHREPVVIPGKRLGRRLASLKPAIYFSNFWNQVTPVHPTSTQYLGAVQDWDIRGNGEFGDCGPVSIANHRALVSKTIGAGESYPSLDDTLDLYRRSGNPNFPADDNGVDLQTMLEEVHANGIAGTKCVAFAKLDVSNIAEVRAAIAIFGGVILGVNLRVAQQNQRIWDYVRGSGEWGGHAVMAANYTSYTGLGQPDLGFVTWGQILNLTDNFWDAQAMEAWVVIWPEHLGTKEFLIGVDMQRLAEDYRLLTGRDLPIPTPPAPAPTPEPTPPPVPAPNPSILEEMKKLWQEIGDWLKKNGIID